MRTERTAPLLIEADEFRRIGHRLVDDIARLLESLPDRKVTPGEDPTAVRAALDASRTMPDSGADPALLLRRATELMFEHSLFNSHPRFWGYITVPAAPIGILGDLLASAVNANSGAWFLSPMASEIEGQTVRWIAELIDYPRDCGGLMVSGGNMANIVCFLAARQANAGWDVRTSGMSPREQPRLRIYCSKETHTWIQKAADLAGVGTDGVRWIATDGELRMRCDELRRQIAADRAAGDRPLMVIGTAGSVSTGAIDPLPEIAAICREERLWFHVDGAYGGLAAMLPDSPPELKALKLADSVAVDPHKWLYAPLEVGCALVRNLEQLRAAFSYHPPYYHFGVEATNYFDLGPQNSRGNRALKVWLALQHVGRRGYEKMLAEDIDLARLLHALVGKQAELQPFTQALSISTFRYVPLDLQARVAEQQEYLNQLNKELLTRLQAGGEAYISNAVLGGSFVLRACIVNFRTTTADIETLPDLVVRLGRQIDRELRPTATKGDAR